MKSALAYTCRLAVRASEKLVPEPLREGWREEWLGSFWRWTLQAAEAGDAECRRALADHARRAIAGAFESRFRREEGLEHLRELLGSPRLCLAICATPLVLLLIFSGGLRATRQMARGLPYPDPNRVVVLAQGPPVMGVRFGFRDPEVKVFAEKANTIESISSYAWRRAAIRVRGRVQDVLAASVDPQFFKVVGAGAPSALPKPGEFLASYEFWSDHLRADPSVIGRRFDVSGRSLRLAGVLPAGFTFLSAPIDVWTVDPGDAANAPAPPRRWWLNLKGAVARLRPGVAPWEAERELRTLQMQAGLARPNYQMHASRIAELVYGELFSYGRDFLLCIAGILLWAAIAFVRDRRRGIPANLAAKFWGFFAAKPILLLTALFFFIFEGTSANTLGATGGLESRGGALLIWVFFMSAVVILGWSWRDQPDRCRVCLQRLRQPLRIGIPGQILLETSGQEVMCPRGHGSVYTSESVLGSEMSNRWMGFEDAIK